MEFAPPLKLTTFLPAVHTNFITPEFTLDVSSLALEFTLGRAYMFFCRGSGGRNAKSPSSTHLLIYSYTSKIQGIFDSKRAHLKTKIKYLQNFYLLFSYTLTLIYS